MKAFIIKCLLFIFFAHCHSYPYRAFCHVPVADLFTVIPTIKNIGQPWDEKNSAIVYPRASQLLFNEQVLVLEQNKGYTRVKVYHWFYIPYNSTKHVDTYWIKNDALTPINNLPLEEQSFIPAPISYKNPKMYDDNVVTLRYPYEHHGTIYSAGTRFVRYDAKIKDNKISVLIFNKPTNTFLKVPIPLSYLEYRPLTLPTQKRETFISLLRQWVQPTDKFFPYVLGGASLTHQHSTQEKIITKNVYVENKEKQFFYRPLYNESLPMGIDCSHLIIRAAHIAQIPLFARNTATLFKTSRSIPKNYIPKNGDFIVWKGHCCIISDYDNQKVIEARGYSYGYGRVHELPLSSIFYNISTYKELLRKYHHKEPIFRIHKGQKDEFPLENLLIIPLLP